jgi:hypothetical protein
MDIALLPRVELIISAPRLQRYRDATSSDPDTVALYCWNIQLAEALLPSIAILEVSLRMAHFADTYQHGLPRMNIIISDRFSI